MAMNGLVSSGNMKLFARVLPLTPCGEAIIPAPTRAPISECVVEMGKLSRVAKSTVQAAASATASPNPGADATAAGTSPFPLNADNSFPARNNAATDPSAVVAVAQISDVRYEAAPLPNSVATPLKLSFAPFAYASSKPIARIKISVTGHSQLMCMNPTALRENRENLPYMTGLAKKT